MSETDPQLLSRSGDKTVTFHWDHDDGGKFHVNHNQDVEPYLERNKAIATSGWDGYDDSRDFRKIGTVPDVIAYEWLTKRGVNLFNPDHKLAVRKLLNDPEYRYLRTTPGRI